jgi:peroxiredoxin Q/BCP
VTGVIRSTFVIGPDGRVAKVFPSVKVDGHADKVLEAVSALAGGGAAKPKAAKPAAKALPAKRTAKK